MRVFQFGHRGLLGRRDKRHRRQDDRALRVETLEERNLLAVLFRVNAGGPQLPGDPIWQADTSPSPSPYNNAPVGNSATGSTNQTIDLSHGSVPTGTPMAVFRSERFDKAGSPNLLWDFPVEPGQYEVRLYFAETWNEAFARGIRVFDVSVEGITVLDNYDIFADVGPLKGVVKTFTVSSDGNLDIDFLRVLKNPTVSGIEIISVGGEPVNRPPVVSAGPDLVISLPTNSVALDGTVNDDGLPANSVITSWSKVTGPGTVSFADASSVDTTAAFSSTGIYVLRLTANDGEFVRMDDVQITVNPAPSGNGVTGFTLINAATDRPMMTIHDGMQIDLTQLATTGVNIRADTSGSVGSIVFDYNTSTGFKTDSAAPFALFSESGGNYQSTILGLGNHTLMARAYSGTGGSGSLINSLALRFQVIVGHSIPDQIHLSWTDQPSSSFSVVWRTFDLSTPSAVEYRRFGDTAWLSQTGARKSSGASGTLHQATVSGLTASTQYEYRVRGDAGTWSDVFVTRTAPPAGPANFDFVYFADTGLVGRKDGLSAGTDQIINDINNLNPLLLLGGGDYAYYSSDKRFGPLDAHIDAWFNQSAPFLTNSIFMPTLGNHEVRLQESYDSWINRMALPAAQTDNFNIYSFDVGQVHFVSILAVMGVQGLPDSQVDWIIRDVQAAKNRGQLWIIPYMHVSAFADGSSHPSNIELRNQLGPVFEQLGVHIVVSSHDQNYERTFPLVNVGQGSPVITDRNLTGYDSNDGIVWLKVSPAGKLSSIDSDFSTFQTSPPPYWTAARNDTMHHFARFVVSTDGTLTTQIFATPGNGTPSVIFDEFTYRLGGAALESTTAHFASADNVNDHHNPATSRSNLDYKLDTLSTLGTKRPLAGRSINVPLKLRSFISKPASRTMLLSDFHIVDKALQDLDIQSARVNRVDTIASTNLSRSGLNDVSTMPRMTGQEFYFQAYLRLF